MDGKQPECSLLCQEREWIFSVYDVNLCSDWLKHAAQVQSEVWNIQLHY